jgi:CDP-paratose 2-epimerase
MSVAIVTGAAGLIGSETVDFFCQLGFEVVGIDNDMRSLFFGPEASTSWNRARLEKNHGQRYRHVDADIRDLASMEALFQRQAKATQLIVHAAAQPSHDWAARDPQTDYSINASATLALLDLTRRHCPDAVFVFLSTNKVYGDTPNRLPLSEQETRWEIDPGHPYASGIDESMSIDASTHSFFGVSKTAADLLVQEYGRHFGLRSACFRAGCLTGPNHSGTALHGFLAYLMRCAVIGQPYTVYGYKGKQVRDNLHSADAVTAFYEFYKAPRAGEIYNIGGGRRSHCSMIEAIDLCRAITGKDLLSTYTPANRAGDHIWYVSDMRKFQSHYPEWRQRHDLRGLMEDIYARNAERWVETQGAPAL